MINDEHILLVEDDQSLQELIEKLLKNNNYIVSKLIILKKLKNL
jgi:DNA-binding response OmpR family regulator